LGWKLKHRGASNGETLQGPANGAMRAGTPIQEFQEHQEFQAFQEIATHFKSVSRDGKSYHEFQQFQEHVSRGSNRF